eukprot:1151909-Pelagomonas_calceolata.AAC.4
MSCMLSILDAKHFQHLCLAGATSVSVWDAPSAASLEAWLNEHLNQDVVHELNEVQEDFSHGIAFELSRARTADRVSVSANTLSVHPMNVIRRELLRSGKIATCIPTALHL